MSSIDVGKQIVQEFIKTAIIIDDRAELALQDPSVSSIPLVPPEQPAEEESGELEPIKIDEKSPLQQARSSAKGRLDVVSITNGFLTHGIMCGVYKPEDGISQNKLIAETIKTLKNADVAILDWYLQDDDEELIQALMHNILKEDSAQGGRLRLIIIYTDHTEFPKCMEVLKNRLEKYCLDKEAGKQFALVGKGIRIRFLNKGKLGIDSAEPGDLADICIGEFAKLTAGILPTFALASVNQLRKSTHHLLSVFSSELDSAIVGHRIMLEDSEDTPAFGLEMLLLQIRSILTTNQIHNNLLSEAVFLSWFDNKFPTYKEDPKKNKQANLKLVRECLMEPSELVRIRNEPPGIGKDKLAKLANNRLFSNGAQELLVTSKMSRLSKLSRERKGFHQLPRNWRPTLSLGSIVRTIVKNKGGEKKLYFLCSMPACDSIRINGNRFFPLLSLQLSKASSSDDYWIVVQDGEKDIKLKLFPDHKFTTYQEFKANKEKERVLGVKKKQTEHYTFTSTDKTEYRWLADVDKLHAQRAAALAASKLNRVGVDEFEYLRRGL